MMCFLMHAVKFSLLYLTGLGPFSEAGQSRGAVAHAAHTNRQAAPVQGTGPVPDPRGGVPGGEGAPGRLPAELTSHSARVAVACMVLGV